MVQQQNGTAYYNNIKEIILQPGDYTFVLPVCSVETANGVGVTVSLGYNNFAVPNTSINNTAGLKNITITEETHVNQLRMWIEDSANFKNYEMQYMLLKGTYTAETIPKFEIYGTMPSINYPSIPVTATGMQTIKVNNNIVENLDLGTTELCKIIDKNKNVVAQDKVVYREVDGVWKWQFGKKIRKVIINSNSTLTYNGLKDNNTLVDFLTEAFPNLPLNIYQAELEKITKYNYLKPNSTNSTGKFRIAVELEKLGLEEVKIPAVAEQALKNLIEEKGDAIIYYVATETTYIDCTAEQSAVLDKLYKLQLERGINSIFAESEDGTAVELQLEYMQDLESKLNNLNSLEERISNLEESVLNL